MNLLKNIRTITPNPLWAAASAFNRELKIKRYRNGKRKFNSGETSKAEPRRRKEGFFEKYCTGRGLDIGYGGDPVTPEVQGFDFENGDAHFLEGIENNSFDFVYSSHTLEHMIDPNAAIKNWYRVLKKGGYLILYIPHRDLYEKKKILPSRFNPTHKNFFLIDSDDPPDTLGIIPLLHKNLDDFKLIYAKECSDNYIKGSDFIQSTGEYSIEVVLQKN